MDLNILSLRKLTQNSLLPDEHYYSEQLHKAQAVIGNMTVAICFRNIYPCLRNINPANWIGKLKF